MQEKRITVKPRSGSMGSLRKKSTCLNTKLMKKLKNLRATDAALTIYKTPI